MRGFFFEKGLHHLGLASTTLTEFGRSRTPTDLPSSSVLGQLAEQVKTIHGELSRQDEEPSDMSGVDSKLLSLIGEGVEYFGRETGQNIDMVADTSIPDTMRDLTDEHKALFQGVKRLIFARGYMQTASHASRPRLRQTPDGDSNAPDPEGSSDKASAPDDSADSDDSADENETATGSSAKEVKGGKKPKPAETESGSDEGSVYNPSESQSVKGDEELE